ncbi:hypothetical protein SAMN05444003_2109 [Cognatiyoonia sediminum]|uniref:Uncharacterized protein n=1 Tax=Cognatiyoonia sediminum TaxID=1508389 RepID=A0A1M5Q7W9_9RHOB|nr:hypothetical protein SAMN05444003_2109 [Cognatiyoonia sediminum]
MLALVDAYKSFTKKPDTVPFWEKLLLRVAAFILLELFGQGIRKLTVDGRYDLRKFGFRKAQGLNSYPVEDGSQIFQSKLFMIEIKNV